MDMIIPPTSGPYFWPEYLGSQRPICIPDSPLLWPGGLPETRLWQRERLPGRPQVWKACTDMVCTSLRMARASWALLRGFRTETKKSIWSMSKESRVKEWQGLISERCMRCSPKTRVGSQWKWRMVQKHWEHTRERQLRKSLRRDISSQWQ